VTAAADPFTALGVPPGLHLSDEQVRAAWRAIATATHPDRADGGDPGRYAAASAAYQVLRTAWGRSEAYADLTATRPPRARPRVPPPPAPVPRPAVSSWRAVALVPSRVRHGRPARLALRILAAAVLALITARSGATTPAIAGVLAGIAIWLVLTGRGDLSTPPGR
jgi:hypothetical protein